MFKVVFPGRMATCAALATLIITTASIAAPQVASLPADQFAALKQLINEELHLSDCEIASIIVPVAVRAPINIGLTIDGRAVQLALSPVSVRSENFVVFTEHNGRRQPVAAPSPHSYRGFLTGRKNSAVAASIQNSQLQAIIHDGDQTWTVEPAPSVAGLVDPSMHVIYKNSDVIPGPWTCGAVNNGRPVPMPPATDARGISTFCTAIAELAIDVDHDYYQLNNSSVPDTVLDIETIINSINLIYGFQVGINYEITEIIVQTSALGDPFTQTSAGGLLDQFITYRNGTPYPTNPMPDEAHLFTGKEINGSVIGIATLGSICNDPLHYGLSQSRFTSNYILRVILTAHEFGHNWNARHCDGDPDCGIMCSAVASCDGVDTRFGERSVADIVAFRDSIGCLQQGSSIFQAGGELIVDELDANQDDNFGTSVDIRENLAIVGAYADDEAGLNAGAAYLLEFDGVEWTQIAKLMPELKPSPAGDRFGASVALDVNGSARRAAVGAYLDTGIATISGSVTIFTEDDKGWTQTQKLTRNPKMAGDLFGYDIAISGPFMIVGAPLADNKLKGKDSGAAFIFENFDGIWVLQETLTAGKAFGAPNDQYGTTVAIDWSPTRGGVALVGAWMSDYQVSGGGAFFVYRNLPGSSEWQFEDAWFGTVAGNQYGYSLDVSGDFAVAGIWRDDTIANNAGAVTIINLAGGKPIMLTEPNLMENDNYGSAVAIDGDLLVVGAYRSDATIQNGGAVYGYRRVGNNWTPLGLFEPPGLGNNDQLGFSIAVSGNLIIAGAWMSDDTASNQGAAHIFVAEEEPTDCDANGVPDSCDIEFGVAFDCDGNGVLDSCDITDGTFTDNDNNGIPDVCDSDCNQNGITDTTEIADGSVPDCNENGYPDSCDVDPLDPDGDGLVSDDVNMDGVPDECSPDCNNNGILDAIDIADMTSLDCNVNGVPDECDLGVFNVRSEQLGPIGAFTSQALALNASTTPPPWAMSNVVVRVLASADLDLTSEYIRLMIDNTEVAELFRSGALECPGDDGFAPDVETRIIPAAVWNAALRNDQAVVITLNPNPSMSPNQCTSGSWASVEVLYVAGDCNGNGILDICETDSGAVADCNDNGVPDSCEIADFDNNNNGIPDDCETCPEDLNGDGAVNVFDLFMVLGDWGPCIGCVTDLAGSGGPTPDGQVNVFDLFALLSAWTTTCP